MLFLIKKKSTAAENIDKVIVGGITAHAVGSNDCSQLRVLEVLQSAKLLFNTAATNIDATLPPGWVYIRWL